MAQPRILTYNDAFWAADDFLRGQGASASEREIRRAVHDALAEVASAHDWTFLYKHGRVNLHAPYETGTVAYDLTGGTYERQVTLTDGTWPAWAEDAVIRIDE